MKKVFAALMFVAMIAGCGGQARAAEITLFTNQSSTSTATINVKRTQKVSICLVFGNASGAGGVRFSADNGAHTCTMKTYTTTTGGNLWYDMPVTSAPTTIYIDYRDRDKVGRKKQMSGYANTIDW